MSAANGTESGDRRAELLRRKTEREEQRAKEAEAHALLLLELEDRFEQELGPVGKEFAIVDLADVGEGAVVVKRPEQARMRQFKSSKMTEANHFDLVKPCVVYPDAAAFLEITGRRDFVVTRCATACAKLHGLKLQEDAGK